MSNHSMPIPTGQAVLENTGEELVFRSKNGEEITLDELRMIRDFIEDSSLSEEWREFKLFRKLRE